MPTCHRADSVTLQVMVLLSAGQEQVFKNIAVQVVSTGCGDMS